MKIIVAGKQIHRPMYIRDLDFLGQMEAALKLHCKPGLQGCRLRALAIKVGQLMRGKIWW